MPYSAFVAVALAIHILINVNMFIKKDNIPAIRYYRIFAIVVSIFYTVDILWGVFDANKLQIPLYVDTIIYFILMGLTVFSWSWFVVKYLEGGKVFSRILMITGALFLLAEIVLLIVNIFTPLLFVVDENAVYKDYPARDVMLWAQIALYSFTTIYSIVYTFVTHRKNYRRYIAISLFSIVMITCIAIQLGDPYIPFYSIGLLIGVCLLNTYALSESKERFKEAYQEESKINKVNKEKLGEAISLAYSDALTGVNNKHAYVELEEKYDKMISNNELDELCLIVFDLNGLKTINDSLGHKAGDQYIVDSVKMIAEFFPFESIYRYGGDEFVVILEGEDVKMGQRNHNKFMHQMDENLEHGKPIISSGMSKYRKDKDFTFNVIFYRADKMMYARKEYLKEHKN